MNKIINWNINEINWNWIFLNHLNKYEEWLKEKIEYWQEIIKKWDEEFKNMNFSEKNIYKWYKKYKETYSCERYKLSPNRSEILEKFKNDNYYIFKNIVEIMASEIVVAEYKIETENLFNNIFVELNVFLTSEKDDIFWWVDLIVELEVDWKKTYTWIDIVVSENDNYIIRKSKKRDKTICMEFNMYKWKDPLMKIPRYVFQFSPKIISSLLVKYLESIERWEKISVYESYQDAKWKEEIEKELEQTRLKVSNLIKI
jgi:hypothetical protein